MEASEAIDTGSCPGFPGSVALGDVNNDGKLDAYIGAFNDLAPDQPNLPSSLLLGDGTGKFTLVPNSGAKFQDFPCVSSFMDLDDDGDSDIVVATCNKLTLDGNGNLIPTLTPIYMYRNSFAQTGTVEFVNDVDGFSIGNRVGLWMNIAFGDLDGDGLLDIFMGQAGCSVLTPEGCLDAHGTLQPLTIGLIALL